MTQEQKQLLLQDLCGRLPYGLKVCIKLPNHQEKIFEEQVGDLKELTRYGEYLVNSKGIDYRSFELDIKPYLRPMSSMTEEEKEHLQTLHDIISDENYGDGFSPAAWEAILDFNNYCREHHLDNGGLITLGLALEAPEEMYKID